MQNNTMKALVLTTAEKTASVKDLPIPIPQANEILVKVHAVALNPTDAVYVANPLAAQPERIVGHDFAGEVVEVPEAIQGSSSDPRLKKGARVSGFMQGACSTNYRPGAFAEYVTPEYDLVWLVPDTMSYEEASTISACGITAAMCIFLRLSLPCPFWKPAESVPSSEAPLPVSIYGASTSLGLFTAQMVQIAAKASGQEIRLIGAASRPKHDMLKEAPYRHSFLVDYREKDWPEQVRGLASGGVDYAVDCISARETVKNTESVLKSTGRFVVVRAPSVSGFSMEELTIKPIYNAVFAALGHELDFCGFKIPRNAEARDFAVRCCEYLTSRSAEGQTPIQPNPVRHMPGCLERIVPDGFALLVSGVMASSFAAGGTQDRVEDFMRPISGEKLVYSI